MPGDVGDPRYLSYFECFNRQHFFEAHEVLETPKMRQAPLGQPGLRKARDG